MPKVKLLQGGAGVSCLPVILSKPLLEVVPWEGWELCAGCLFLGRPRALLTWKLGLIQLLPWSLSVLFIFLLCCEELITVSRDLH